MNSTYLTDAQINEMANAAANSYEMACEWRIAGRAAREHAADEWGIRATDAQVATAVRIAQVKWQAISMSAKQGAA